MPKTLFKVDLTKPMDQQELPGHNRWHPEIPAVVSVNLGDERCPFMSFAALRVAFLRNGDRSPNLVNPPFVQSVSSLADVFFRTSGKSLFFLTPTLAGE